MQTMNLLEATAFIRDGVCLLEDCQSIDDTAIGRGALIITTEGHFKIKVQVSFAVAQPDDGAGGDPKLSYSPSTHSIRWWPENYLAADLNRVDPMLREERHRLGYLFAGAPRLLAFAEHMAKMGLSRQIEDPDPDGDVATLDAMIERARDLVKSFGPPVRPISKGN